MKVGFARNRMDEILPSASTLADDLPLLPEQIESFLFVVEALVQEARAIITEVAFIDENVDWILKAMALAGLDKEFNIAFEHALIKSADDRRALYSLGCAYFYRQILRGPGPNRGVAEFREISRRTIGQGLSSRLLVKLATEFEFLRIENE
jgi:hypothetical protein